MSYIVGIDPGNEKSAWCELRGESVENSMTIFNENMLALIRERTVFWKQADFVAIEMIASYGMPVGREVFDTCLWIGRFMEALESRGAKVLLVYRREVKLFHCQSARATDANIRAAIIDRYGPGKDKAIGKKSCPGPLYGLKADEWSALAVALTADSKFIRLPDSAASSS